MKHLDFYALRKVFPELLQYKCVSLSHTLGGCCGSKHPWGTPRCGATHLCVVPWCLLGGVTSCRLCRLITSGCGVTVANALSEEGVFPNFWCLLCCSMVSRAIPLWANTIQCGLFPYLVPQTNWFYRVSLGNGFPAEIWERPEFVGNAFLFS